MMLALRFLPLPTLELNTRLAQMVSVPGPMHNVIQSLMLIAENVVSHLWATMLSAAQLTVHVLLLYLTAVNLRLL